MDMKKRAQKVNPKEEILPPLQPEIKHFSHKSCALSLSCPPPHYIYNTVNISNRQLVWFVIASMLQIP